MISDKFVGGQVKPCLKIKQFVFLVILLKTRKVACEYAERLTEVCSSTLNRLNVMFPSTTSFQGLDLLFNASV